MSGETCVQCGEDGATLRVEIRRVDGVVGVAMCHRECKEALIERIQKLHERSHGRMTQIRDETVS